MAIGSGIGSQFGLGAEGSYGTYQAPTRFYEAKSAKVSKVKNTASWDGLAAGRQVMRNDGRVVTTKAATVAVPELVVTTKDMGLILNQVFGGTVTPIVDGATSSFTQTHPLVDVFGKSATLQSGVPLTGGTVIPQSALGCKLDDVEFACGVDSPLLTMNVNFDAKDLTEGQTLAAASYATGRSPFHFGQMQVLTGTTVAGATSADGVRKVTCKIDRKLKTDMFYANNLGLKDQPIQNDFAEITGVISADYKTAAHWADRFRDDTGFSLVLKWVGANIQSTFFQTFELDLPVVFLDGDTPGIDGPDVVQTDFPYRAYFDLTNAPVTCIYRSTDTVL